MLPPQIHPDLQRAASTIPTLLVKSVAKNTFKSYSQGFNTWKNWASQYPTICPLPASKWDFALFLATEIQNSCKYGKVYTAFYGVKWIHEKFQYENPCESNLVVTLLEAAKRLLQKPTVKKKPITPTHLQTLVESLYGTNLLRMRTLATSLLSYTGFLRIDEAINLRRNDVHFEEDHMKLFITHSKCDQEGHGSWVHIAKTSNPTCPYKILRKYLKLACILRDSTQFIFRPCRRNKQGYVLTGDRPISYTTIRKDLLRALADIGIDRQTYGVHLYGTHSMRRGGASTSARAGTNERIWKKHGRWSSDKAKDGYVSEDLTERLAVSQNLGV